MKNEEVFESFSPFIREYIYRKGWTSLHELQTESAKIIFERDCNLLLSSSTASGKTEAAFFPILSEFEAVPPMSFGALYIAPLKALINDQFDRISALTEEAGIPVYHWHGDVSQSRKADALNNPGGILQITPESLEAMFVRRGNDIPRLFCDLRYIVIDEIHTLMGTERGSQILCLISRLQRKAGINPRRIGLSATLGNLDKAAEWLSCGSERETVAPVPGRGLSRFRIGMEWFSADAVPEQESRGAGVTERSGVASRVLNWTNCLVQDPERVRAAASHVQEGKETHGEVSPSALDKGFEFVYNASKGKKTIVFSNSREETEYVTATLRQIAEKKNERDVFYIHHGNLSAALREETEAKLKEDDDVSVACATVTLELGIDIGRLERIIHMGAPISISAFLQRLGRSGRRGDPPEMIMVFREESPLPNAPIYELIPWELVKAVAIVKLYTEDRYIETKEMLKCPFSLLIQQTLSTLASDGSMKPKELADRVLSLPVFEGVDREDYRHVLFSLIRQDLIEADEEGDLLIGLFGERIIKSFKFFAVFKDSEDFTVRCGSDEIGTVTGAYPTGDRFALAGRVWEVEECDAVKRLIFVKPVKGKMEISWPGDYGETDTEILKKMREVLLSSETYPYLSRDAMDRLNRARALVSKSKLSSCDIISVGGGKWVFFPWLGTRSFNTMRRFLGRHADEFGISGIDYGGCYYITFRSLNEGEETLKKIADEARRGIDIADLVAKKDAPPLGKYDAVLEPELLKKQYCLDRLRADEIEKKFS